MPHIEQTSRRGRSVAGRRAARLAAALLALAIAALALAACGKDGESEGKSVGGIDPSAVVARYDGGEVTGRQLIAYLGAHKFLNLNEMYGFYEMLPSFKQDMLYRLIATRLITAEADEETDKASRASAAEMIAALEKTLDQDEEYKKGVEQFLESEGITLKDIEDYLVQSLNLQAVLEKKFSDDDLRARYDQILKEDENAFLRATVRHVLVGLTDGEGNERTEEEALKRIKEAQVKLKNGADWKAVAREYSEDPGSKENGGRYEDVEVSLWVEEFKRHAIEQPVGELGEPFKTSYGYHIMLVEDRRQPGFEEVREDIREMVASEYFFNMVEQEVPKLVTEVNLPEPELPEGFENVEAGGTDGGGETDGSGDTENTGGDGP